ncbi:MAG TPA: hypothetical protein VNI77_00285 [Nitrososphaera sp.]|nr:hypothetical protein [Nitrososphaera sp.]
MIPKKIRGKDGRIRGSAITGMVVAAMIVAMVPAVLAISNTGHTDMVTAEAADPKNKPYFKVIASNALYEPNAGRTNVFGPGGIFPFFNDTFSCGDAITCGVEVEGDRFRGVFKEGGGQENKFFAEYVSPITYGDHQVAGHKYRIELVDTLWNSNEVAMPTRQPQFLAEKGNVAFNQIQHGHSNIDRADVPMFFNDVALYGHVNVYDVTDGNKLVAENLFTHLMVGKVIDEEKAFENLQFTPATQTVVALFVVNIPSGVELPGGIGPLTPEQAISFTPLGDDTSLGSTPPVDYGQLGDEGLSAQEPMSQSTPWPVDNPEQPVFFTFLLFTDVKAGFSSNGQMAGLS